MTVQRSEEYIITLTNGEYGLDVGDSGHRLGIRKISLNNHVVFGTSAVMVYPFNSKEDAEKQHAKIVEFLLKR